MAVQCFAGGGLGLSGFLCVPVRSVFFNLTPVKEKMTQTSLFFGYHRRLNSDGVGVFCLPQ
jgi:hypothetical protein